MYLIVGLGNIGEKYSDTRHNIGFAAVDLIHREYEFDEFKVRKKSLISSGTINTQKISLLKPLTYMNNSGIAVSEFVSFYKIPLQNILVIYDDMDIECGKAKFKFAGGSAGHNGIKSIDAHVGIDYWRLRIGISKPKFADISNYVLSKFTEEQISVISGVLQKISKNIDLALLGNKDKFLNSIK
ncbi:Peptidyl-tRNA hydrolase [Candidatus Cyrtobacter comes]|uniref:Peptidyl-tRNA hydrolase n=1 Tax=Candidatus Cyrtobacter comes TaxID=675776 RepID=A0ABU5L8Y9_9RICK|nr:aminoacyl-tRNA hydrolase [Candidatus Cyrtobacter comes]MDZ5762587.1 Peptidyl-tRNA hydrolase [Candidatus Cyrtobacter comes]